MKDGTTYSLEHSDSHNRDKANHTITFILKGKSINPADVASIVFLGQNIKL